MKTTKLIATAAAVFAAAVPAAGQPSAALSAADQAEIRALSAEYLSALRSCSAERYAELFAAGTGYFASGFRGQMTGRDQLVALVQSERHCIAPADSATSPRRSDAGTPTVEIEVTEDGVFGVTDLGGAQYQDEYVQTADGWRFASRWVLIPAEIEAGLDAREMIAIRNLSGSGLGEHYVADAGGAERLLHAGVTIGVGDDAITGRVYLTDGSYYDDVYEQLGPGRWRIDSRTLVPPQAR